MSKTVWLSVLILTIGLVCMPLIGVEGLLHTDFVQQLIPFYAETRHALLAGEWPLWTWNAFLGDNFIAQFAYYTLFNPTAWLTALFPVGYMGWGIVLALYLKTCLCACFAHLYLRRLGFGASYCCAGALAYTFTSFYITGMVYFFFVEPAALFALLLWALEGVVGRRRYAFTQLAAVTFAVVAVNYYFAIASLLCGAAYLALRLWTGEGRRPGMEFLKGAGAALTGVCGAAFILLPTALFIASCPRLSAAGVSVSEMGVMIFERVFYALVPRLTEGPQTAFVSRTFSSISLFVPAMGLLGAALWARRQPRHWASIAVVAGAIFYFTPLNGIFTLFTEVKYERWGYALQMMLIVATLFEARELRGQSKSRAGAVYACLVVAACAVQFAVAKVIAPGSIGALAAGTVGFGVAAAVVTWICATKGFSAKALTCGTVAVASVNFVLFDYFCVLRQSADPEGFSTSDRMMRIFDGRGFAEAESEVFEYRTDMRAICPNQGMLENRPGVLAYISGVSGVTMPMRQLVTSSAVNQQMVIAAKRRSLDALLSVKEFRDYGVEPPNYQAAYEGLPAVTYMEDGAAVYELPDYIPMGMAYDTFIPESEFKGLYADVVSDGVDFPYVALSERNDSIDLCLQMLANLVVADEDTASVVRWMRKGRIDASAGLDSVVNARRALTAKSFRGTREGFTAEFDSPRDAFYFLSVPADPGFSLRLDGEPLEAFNVNLGMTGVMIPAGKHCLTAAYLPQGLVTGLCVTACAVIVFLTIWRIEYKRQ
ncbi:MAG: YfhO family protein [Duncaniella sp.]|nr:YfhO family protein [Duncaniella sp.]